MQQKLVYDLPTRFFHWTFAILFIAAFFIAKTFDDESSTYPYHMIFGLVMAAAVLFRIGWGLMGSRYARFSSFQLSPTELVQYFKSLFSRQSKKYFGHNPASSWAAIIMMLLSLGLAFTGWQMASGHNKELFEDLHELLANAFLITVIAHIAGLILHTIRHQEMIALSMLSGRKQGSPSSEPIKNQSLIAGLTFVLLIGYFATHLFRQYDPLTRTLSLFGQKLQLGENESDDEAEKEDDDE